MTIWIPCLDKAHRAEPGSTLSVQPSLAVSPFNEFGEIALFIEKDGVLTLNPDFEFQSGFGLTVTPGDSPVSVTVTPVYPYISVGMNWSWVFDQLFGETHIGLQHKQVQSFYTPIFRYINKQYGYPITDNHAMDFESKGVRHQLLVRPDLAALAPTMQEDAAEIVTGAFGYDKSGPGIEQRIVNQLLANAAYNGWSVQATIDVWDALIYASSCAPAPRPQTMPSTHDYAQDLLRCDLIKGKLVVGIPFDDADKAFINTAFGLWCLQGNSGWLGPARLGVPGDWITLGPTDPWLPEGTQVLEIPQSQWLYDFPSGTQVLEIEKTVDQKDYPKGAQIVEIPGQTPVIVWPGGQVFCLGPKPAPMPKPMPRPRPGTQPFPMPPAPQPMPVPPGLQDLLQRIDQIGQQVLEIQQNQTVQQQLLQQQQQQIDRIGRQVLEIPPAPQPPLQLTDPVPTYLLDQINQVAQRLETCCQQIQDCCDKIGQQPDNPLPVDVCQEGREQWGIQAECWLDTNTPDKPAEPLRLSESLLGQDFVTQLRMGLEDTPTGHFAQALLGYADKIKAAIAIGVMPGPNPPPSLASQDLSYVYERIGAP